MLSSDPSADSSGAVFIEQTRNNERHSENAVYCNSHNVSIATQTSDDESSVLPPLLSESWQFSKEISSAGGFLQGDHSDVRLEVPNGAVEKGVKVKVSGAVCTDMEKAHTYLHLPEEECIHSPVVEYHLNENYRFKRPVRIVLPHFLPSGFLPETVKVYGYDSSTKTIETLRLATERDLKTTDLDQAAQDEVELYYFGDGNVIYLLVHHFSFYFCVHCHTDFKIPSLTAKLFAKHIETEGGERIVDVLLKVWDDRLAIKDFWIDSIKNQQMKLVDDRQLPDLPSDSDFDPNTIVLGMRLELLTEEDTLNWKHRHRQDGQPIYAEETTTPLSKLVPCKCRGRPITKNWQLTNTGAAPPDAFQCVVDVGYATATLVLLGFLNNPEKETFDIRIHKEAEIVDLKRATNDHKPSNLHHQPMLNRIQGSNVSEQTGRRTFETDREVRSGEIPAQTAEGDTAVPSGEAEAQDRQLVIGKAGTVNVTYNLNSTSGTGEASPISRNSVSSNSSRSDGGHDLPPPSQAVSLEGASQCVD